MKWCELREYKWNEYVTIAVNRNLSNCENSPKKRLSGLQRDSNPWPAVLSQLSYEDPYTGGWPIYRVHQPVKGMKHWMKWCELRLFSQLLKLRFTAMVTYSFHLYSRSSHHFIKCFIPFHGLMNSMNWPASSVWVFKGQLGEHCSANAEATGSNPVEAPKIFFSGYFRNCLNCDSLRRSHTHFIRIYYYY